MRCPILFQQLPSDMSVVWEENKTSLPGRYEISISPCGKPFPDFKNFEMPNCHLTSMQWKNFIYRLITKQTSYVWVTQSDANVFMKQGFYGKFVCNPPNP